LVNVRRPGSDFLKAVLCSPFPPIALFVLFALACISYPGLQQDEVLFARPLLRPGTGAFHVSIAGTSIPLMLMSYVGALKSLLYMPLVHFFQPTPLLMRLPCVAAAAFTLYLLYRLLLSLHSRAAALIATFLLATDSAFLLTSTFDWGPVALQHLLLVAVILCLHRFHSGRRTLYLALGFFLAGLALWDKAVAVWMASGLTIGILVLYLPQLKEHLSPKNLAVSMLALGLGASPLIAFNVARSFPTVTENSAFEARGPVNKLTPLFRTLNGAALLGYLVNEETQGAFRQPETPFENVVAAVDDAFRRPAHNALPALLLLAIVALPFSACRPARRLGIFLLLSFLVAWLFMASIRNAGGSVHHIVLLWPLPHMFAGIVLAQLLAAKQNWRGPMVILIALSTCLNAANMNHYLAQSIRYAPAWVWTDASTQLPRLLASQGARVVGVDDWGIASPLDVVTSGKLTILDATAADPESVTKSLAEALWIGWAPGFAVQPETSRRVLALAGLNGLEKKTLLFVSNRNSQSMLELYQFVPKGAGSDARIAGDGVFDDQDPAIRYSGKWIAGEFRQAFSGTLKYSDETGASAQIAFRGSSVVFVYTKAFNRGMALIRIDDAEVARLDLYDPDIHWQQHLRVNHLSPGEHRLSVEVLGRANPRSKGNFVDLDGIIVERGQPVSKESPGARGEKRQPG